MTNVVDCTVWWAETGETYTLCQAVDGKLNPGNDKRVYWEGHINPVTHKFDVETGLPVLRVTPLEVPQGELHIEINRERQRRIEFGKDIAGIRVTGSDKDVSNLTNLALGAQLRIGMGDTTTVTVFRDGDNVDHELLPQQVLELWMAASAYVSAIYQASWTLKAIDPIPQDVASDQYWPA